MRSRGADALVIALALSIAVLASWPVRFDVAAPPAAAVVAPRAAAP